VNSSLRWFLVPGPRVPVRPSCRWLTQSVRRPAAWWTITVCGLLLAGCLGPFDGGDRGSAELQVEVRLPRLSEQGEPARVDFDIHFLVLCEELLEAENETHRRRVREIAHGSADSAGALESSGRCQERLFSVEGETAGSVKFDAMLRGTDYLLLAYAATDAEDAVWRGAWGAVTFRKSEAVSQVSIEMSTSREGVEELLRERYGLELPGVAITIELSDLAADVELDYTYENPEGDTVDLTGEVRVNRGATFSVSVVEAFDSYRWLLNGEDINGEETEDGTGREVDIGTDQLWLGDHTVTVIVERDGEEYSAGFVFSVVDDALAQAIMIPDAGNGRIVLMDDMVGDNWRELELQENGDPIEPFYPVAVVPASNGRVLVVGGVEEEPDPYYPVHTGFLVVPTGEVENGIQSAEVEETLDFSEWHTETVEVFVGNRVAYDVERDYLYYAAAPMSYDLVPELFRWQPGWSEPDPVALPGDAEVTGLEVDPHTGDLYVTGYGEELFGDPDFSYYCGVARLDPDTGEVQARFQGEMESFQLEFPPVDVRYHEESVYIVMDEYSASGPEGEEHLVFSLDPVSFELEGSFGTRAQEPDAPQVEEFLGPVWFAGTEQERLVVLDWREVWEPDYGVYSRLVAFDDITGMGWQVFQPEVNLDPPGDPFDFGVLGPAQH